MLDAATIAGAPTATIQCTSELEREGLSIVTLKAHFRNFFLEFEAKILIFDKVVEGLILKSQKNEALKLDCIVIDFYLF